MFNATYIPKPKRPTRLPQYRRAEKPPKMMLTAQDVRGLVAIYEHEGVLADYQFGRLVFDSVAYGQRRASKLFHNGYIWWPRQKQRAQLPYNIYYLDERGVAQVAAYKRVLPSQLHWRRPGARWSLIQHDVALDDWRIAITREVSCTPWLKLIEWIPEFRFATEPDVITYQDRRGDTQQKAICPDGCFAVAADHEPRVYRFFMEKQRTFKSIPDFLEKKVRPELAYVTSAAYQERFGDNGGRWLVVVSSERRIRNILKELERQKIANAHWFYFAPQKAITCSGVMTRPIWSRVGKQDPFALFPFYPVS